MEGKDGQALRSIQKNTISIQKGVTQEGSSKNVDFSGTCLDSVQNLPRTSLFGPSKARIWKEFCSGICRHSTQEVARTQSIIQ